MQEQNNIFQNSLSVLNLKTLFHKVVAYNHYFWNLDLI